MRARVVFISVPAILVMLGFVSYSGLLAGPPGKGAAPKRGQTVASLFTSVKEREAMGVAPSTWTGEHGKVQPEVRTALEEEKDLEKNMDKDLMAAMYKPGRPVGFLSMVYVAVHLQVEQGKSKEETRAAIQMVQSRVLRELSAAEFGVFSCLKDHPAVVGYANEPGLAKLAKDENVIAIGLDTRPFPRDRTQFYSQGVEEMDNELRKVTTQVRAALKKVDYVRVIVILNLDGVRGPKDLDEIRQAQQIQNRVLSRLTAEEFRMTLRPLPGGLRGYVNAAGLIKLNKDPDVVGVGLPGPPAKLPGFKGRRP